jgi:hypothetical protein
MVQYSSPVKSINVDGALSSEQYTSGASGDSVCSANNTSGDHRGNYSNTPLRFPHNQTSDVA